MSRPIRSWGRAASVALALVATLSLAPAPAWAEPMARAKGFLAELPGPARSAIVAGGRQTLRNLGSVLERGRVDRSLLRDVATNPRTQPHLTRTLDALSQVDRLPGVADVLTRMARARDEGGVRGAAFEIQAGAALGPRLTSLSAMVAGEEWDGRLRDGTVVSMKSMKTHNESTIRGTLRHARKQLQRRTQGKRPAMLVIGHEPGHEISFDHQSMTNRLATPLTVVLVNHQTGACRTVFSGKPQPIAQRAKALVTSSVATAARQVRALRPSRSRSTCRRLTRQLRRRLPRPRAPAARPMSLASAH